MEFSLKWTLCALETEGTDAAVSVAEQCLSFKRTVCHNGLLFETTNTGIIFNLFFMVLGHFEGQTNTPALQTSYLVYEICSRLYCHTGQYANRLFGWHF